MVLGIASDLPLIGQTQRCHAADLDVKSGLDHGAVLGDRHPGHGKGAENRGSRAVPGGIGRALYRAPVPMASFRPSAARGWELSRFDLLRCVGGRLAAATLDDSLQIHDDFPGAGGQVDDRLDDQLDDQWHTRRVRDPAWCGVWNRNA